MKNRAQKCGNELNKKLLEAPMLRYPNERYPYTLTTDASLTVVGVILTQKKNLRVEFLHSLADL